MKKLIIVGAGGFGREVHAWAIQSQAFGRDWVIKGFLDDNPDSLKGMNSSAPIIGRMAEYQPTEEDLFVCAIGTPALRRAVHQYISERGGEFTNVVHPTVILGENVSLGKGVILCPHVVITVNVSVGDGVALNLQTIVGHDAIIGDWCQISPHCDILGHAVLEDEVFMGSHAAVLPGVRIGSKAVLGSGAIANRDIPSDVTAVGMPARSR